MNRVLIVADVSNLYYCLDKKFNGGRLDYGSYLRAATNSNDLYRAIAYGAQLGSDADKFTSALRHLGWITKFKTPLIYPNSDETETRKADWDVGIAMDVVRAVERFDTLVLGSADGDMAPLVEWVQEQGATVHVFACGISRTLKDVATTWVEIDSSLLMKKEAA